MAGKNHVLAVKIFEVGNVFTLAVGLGTGNIALVLTTLGFLYYNQGVYHDPQYRAFLFCIFAYLFTQTGLNPKVFMDLDWIGLVATFSALRGAWCVIHHRFTEMSWQWIFADTLFTYIGIRDGLPGFAIQSFVFILCGVCRLRGFDPFLAIRKRWDALNNRSKTTLPQGAPPNEQCGTD